MLVPRQATADCEHPIMNSGLNQLQNEMSPSCITGGQQENMNPGLWTGSIIQLH